MNQKDTVFDSINKQFDEYGYTLSDFLLFQAKRNTSLLNLGTEAHAKFCAIYQELCKQNVSAQRKGRLLEDIVNCLFQDGYKILFDSRRNCRTSTNEIDILLLWTDIARNSGVTAAYSFLGDSILCECKNYKKSVDVSYVGKFCSLMRCSGTNFGCMFAWNGLSGRGKWDASKGLVRKIVLKDNAYIIAIDKNDLHDIYEQKANIFSILYRKYEAVKYETDYGQYIQPHEAEGKL